MNRPTGLGKGTKSPTGVPVAATKKSRGIFLKLLQVYVILLLISAVVLWIQARSFLRSPEFRAGFERELSALLSHLEPDATFVTAGIEPRGLTGLIIQTPQIKLPARAADGSGSAARPASAIVWQAGLIEWKIWPLLSKSLEFAISGREGREGDTTRGAVRVTGKLGLQEVFRGKPLSANDLSALRVRLERLDVAPLLALSGVTPGGGSDATFALGRWTGAINWPDRGSVAASPGKFDLKGSGGQVSAGFGTQRVTLSIEDMNAVGTLRGNEIALTRPLLISSSGKIRMGISFSGRIHAAPAAGSGGDVVQYDMLVETSGDPMIQQVSALAARRLFRCPPITPAPRKMMINGPISAPRCVP